MLNIYVMTYATINFILNLQHYGPNLRNQALRLVGQFVRDGFQVSLAIHYDLQGFSLLIR